MDKFNRYIHTQIGKQTERAINKQIKKTNKACFIEDTRLSFLVLPARSL